MFLRLFTQELENLGAEHLPISVKQLGNVGETVLKLEIAESPFIDNFTLTEILSEGEVKVVALAGFLAEVSLGPGEGCIVMDEEFSEGGRSRGAERIHRLMFHWAQDI